MIGTKFNKPLKDFDGYAAAAQWCNENGGATIEDRGDYYEVVEIAGPSLDEIRSKKLSELDAAFMAWYEKDAVVTSSLGFVADSDSRAIMDVSGLVTALEAQPLDTRSTVAFMDHENVSHNLTLSELKVVRLEIIQNGQASYAQKWAYRSKIESAQSVDEIKDLTFDFKGEDFSDEAS